MPILMHKAKDDDFIISGWLRNRNTIEDLGIWERIHNPNFNYGEFPTIKRSAGLLSYKISIRKWVKKLNNIAISQMQVLLEDAVVKNMEQQQP